MPRRQRIRSALFTLFSVVMMQFALAVYACPSVSGPVPEVSAPCDHGGMAPQPSDSALCVEHCKVGAQHVLQLDAGQPVAVPLLLPLYVSDGDDRGGRVPRPTVGEIARPPPPEHALFHCCFRL